jgi:hypothetical protein
LLHTFDIVPLEEPKILSSTGHGTCKNLPDVDDAIVVVLSALGKIFGTSKCAKETGETALCIAKACSL